MYNLTSMMIPTPFELRVFVMNSNEIVFTNVSLSIMKMNRVFISYLCFNRKESHQDKLKQILDPYF